ncbi:serine/threonine protein kinase [Phytophthora cinnamomi]|uniref:serine/threonine protein kinase n=1 Tax=Phytophthora cinnamomi TaxID=4785 RepID=UPI00355968B5|nr:serine/threonine protein kinase [Phytophthora cinnamomi]
MIRQRYRLKHKIGDALYGSVCACEDTHNDNELVAIKQVSLELATTLLAVHPNTDNPWHERRTITKLLALPPHPNIVHFRQEFLHNESWFVVMEHCPEGDLWDRVRGSPNGRVPEREALRLCRQVTLGLHFLHSNGIAHRDVSLENVLLRGGVCKLSDFGLATDAERMCAEVVGKANYMAPEVVAGEAYAPVAADMWSLGIVLFIMLTGSPLVSRASEKENDFVTFLQLGVRRVIRLWDMSSFISEDACSLVSALLRRDPARRPSTYAVLTHPLLNQL